MNVFNLSLLPYIKKQYEYIKNKNVGTYNYISKNNNINPESADMIYSYRTNLQKNIYLNANQSQKGNISINNYNINSLVLSKSNVYNNKKNNLSQTRYGSNYYKKKIYKLKDNISRNKTPTKSLILQKDNENSAYINNKKNNINKSNMNFTLYRKYKECPLCYKKIESYKYNFHYNSHPSQILPWLYLGSYKNACNLEDLRNLNITYILNCAFECLNHFPKTIKYRHLKLFDNPLFNIISYLDKAIDFIDEAKNNNANILVHCQMGISRSASCVLAYLISKCNYNVISGLQFVKKKRPIIMPNYGFLQQLRKFENKIKI